MNAESRSWNVVACFAVTMLVAMLSPISRAHATVFGGVDFPAGAISFADAVVSFDPPASGPGRPAAPYLFPAEALGIPDFVVALPDDGYVSLGDGGSITLEFIDNALTGSGSGAFDLWIFEIGPDVEDTFVEVSKDGATWFSVGKVFGATAGINLDAFGFGISDEFFFVRLTDDTAEGGQSGATVGADIDAVGAISTVAVSTVPEPSAFLIFALGATALAAVKRPRLWRRGL